MLIKVVGAQFGFDGAFWFQAILLLIGAGFLTRVDVPAHEHVRDRRPVLAETSEAVRHILDDKHLTTLFALLFTASFTINPAVMVTVQALVKNEFGRGADDAAFPFAAMGAGIAVSSFFLMRKGEMANKGAVFQRAMMVGTAVTFSTGLAPQFWQVIALGGVMGLAGGFFINMNQGLIQSNTPPEMMGRVMGLYALVSGGLTPFGALALGFLGQGVGNGAAISLVSALAFSIVLTIFLRGKAIREIS